jgi:hypothetical protein
LLTTLFLLAQVISIVAGALVFVTFLGLGTTELLLSARGYQVLLAPAVGLAILIVGFQWLTFVVPPHIAAAVLFIALAPLNVGVAWRRRRTLLVRWRDLLGAGSAMLVFAIGLLEIVVQRGFATMGSFPADNIFIYVQAAQYLKDHPMPSAFNPVAIANPGSYYLATTGSAFPNSVGALDAAASVLMGLPVHVVFDPLGAFGLAITVAPVWFFVRAGLNGSWWTAIAACALLATNQLLYWVFGVGLQQECLALPIFVAGLGIAALAFETGGSGAGVALGVVGAALAGMYLPLAALLVVCAGGCLMLSLATGKLRPRRRVLLPIGWAVLTGVGCSLAAIFVLLFEGGMSLWLSWVGLRIAGGDISTFPPLPYALGTLPFGHVWELVRQPLDRVDRLFFPALAGASIVLLLLLLLGQVRAVLQRHAAHAAILAAALAFVGYEAAVARYPYAFVKSIGYMAPLTSAFVAYGAAGLGPAVAPRLRGLAKICGAAALALVLLASAESARDMVRLWLDEPPALTQPLLALSQLPSDVPAGSSVLIDVPATDYGKVVQAGAAAYFLPDRAVRVFIGATRLGTFADQDVRPRACAFDYVISSTQPDNGFELSASYPGLQLNVYRRLGPACR